MPDGRGVSEGSGTRTLLLVALLIALAVVVALASPALSPHGDAPVSTPHTAGAGDASVGTSHLTVDTTSQAGTIWYSALLAWSRAAEAESGGRLRLEIRAAGVRTELDVGASLRGGSADAALLPPNALAEVAPSVLALQAPFVCTDFDRLQRARSALASEHRQAFAAAGLELLGWADLGFTRIFSTRPVATPVDLASARPWARSDDPLFLALIHAAGTQGVATSAPTVRVGLAAGSIESLAATPFEIRSTDLGEWLTHTTDPPLAIASAATVIRRDRLERLPSDLRDILFRTATAAHEALAVQSRAEDRRLAALPPAHEIQRVDATQHIADWEAVASTARDHLVGGLFSREQLERAAAACR